MLAQARACANGYALATEGIAVVSDFQNNECHIYSGRFGQTIMDFPEYMVDHTSAFENTVFSHANEEELIQRHILELRFFNFIKELPINEKTNFSASCIISFYRTGSNETIKIGNYILLYTITKIIKGYMVMYPFIIQSFFSFFFPFPSFSALQERVFRKRGSRGSVFGL